MSSEFSIGEDIKELVNEIISNCTFEGTPEIKYQSGSEKGDGYLSKIVSVTIKHGNESFNVVLKCALNVPSTETMPINELYAREIYFYDAVIPAYTKFMEKINVKNGFRNVPKYYASSVKNKMIALENLKQRGFILYDRRSVMNDIHIEFVLKTFAKFHAVCFAYKDQEKENYDKLLKGASEDLLSKILEVESVGKLMTIGIRSFIEKLDPIVDKNMLEKCDKLDEKIIHSLTSPNRVLNEYSILTQGDCWCNNMMFLYDNENPGKPIDIMLIDWQMLRQASPVFDIAYFFYTIASEVSLDNLHHHLKLYHEQLSANIKEMGSDPEILYPSHVFENEWKQHALYGYAMASHLLRLMLSSQDEAVSMEGLDLENDEDLAKMYPVLNNEAEYLRRIKILTEHVIKYGYL